MGNKQTIFTDEQLDAYQVSLHVCAHTCIMMEDVFLYFRLQRQKREMYSEFFFINCAI